MSITTNRVIADGLDFFYREAGPANAPVLLLLHGFPSSSHQFRTLIPLLSHKYHIIAPDLPGFGFTEVPLSRDYTYTFFNIAASVEAFLDILKIQKFSVYIFDYGAPTALRIALKRPQAIQSIISQNGNAYEEGLGSPWTPLRLLWVDKTPENVEAVRAGFLTFEATKWQYENGAKSSVAPESYHLDWALLSRTGNQQIQLDLLYDYRENVKLYPQFQQFFRESGVPILAVWGKNDTIFIPAGAEAYRKDGNTEVKLLDAGHFALETNVEDISKFILEFLAKNSI